MTMVTAVTTKRRLPRLFHRQKKKRLGKRQGSQRPLITSASADADSDSVADEVRSNMAPLAVDESHTDKSANDNTNTNTAAKKIRSLPGKRHLQTDGSSAEQLQSMLKDVVARGIEKGGRERKRVPSSSSHRRMGSSYEGGNDNDGLLEIKMNDGSASGYSSIHSHGQQRQHPRQGRQSLKSIASDESSGRKLESILKKLINDENEMIHDHEAYFHAGQQQKQQHRMGEEPVKNTHQITLSTHSKWDTNKRTRIMVTTSEVREKEKDDVVQDPSSTTVVPTDFKISSSKPTPQYVMEGSNDRLHRQVQKSYPGISMRGSKPIRRGKGVILDLKPTTTDSNNRNSMDRMQFHNESNGETYLLLKCGGIPSGSCSSNKSISTCSMDSVLEDPQRLQMERDRYKSTFLSHHSSPPPPPPIPPPSQRLRKKVTFAKTSLSDWTQDIRYSVVNAYERWFSCD